MVDLFIGLLLIMFLVIDLILFIYLFIYKKCAIQFINELYKRSIEIKKSLDQKIYGFYWESVSYSCFCFFVCCIIDFFPETYIQIIFGWYKEIWLAVLLPIAFDWIREKRINIHNLWKIILIVLTVLFSVVSSMNIEKQNKFITQYRMVVNIFIAIYITAFIKICYDFLKKTNQYKTKQLPNKKIRVDLYNRTPKLNVNISTVELIQFCEKYFVEYMHRFEKVGEICTIEYVNLMGTYKKLWYSKVAKFIKKVVAISFVMCCLGILIEHSLPAMILIGLIVVFGVFIKIYKKNAEEHLMIRLMIRTQLVFFQKI